MSELIITMEDMKAMPCGSRIGYCNRGARLLALRAGLDWRKFRHEGISASVLEDTGDAQAIRLVEWVRNGR